MAERDIAAFGPPAHFYECPRWHGGRWWASDMRGGTVYSFSAAGVRRIEVELERPGGLGWREDGRLLVVAMEQRRLVEMSGDTHAVVASHDFSGLLGDTDGFLNDLVVARSGHVYVGFDANAHRYGLQSLLGRIVHLAPDGTARLAADGLAFPNGMVCSLDGDTLIVAETMQSRLAALPMLADGALGAPFVWGATDPVRAARACRLPPGIERAVNLDGCAIDAEGLVWAADVGSGCLRLAPGGEIVDAVVLPDGLRCFACALGGADGRSLLLCGADDNFADRTSRQDAQMFTTRVDVPAA